MVERRRLFFRAVFQVGPILFFDQNRSPFGEEANGNIELFPYLADIVGVVPGAVPDPLPSLVMKIIVRAHFNRRIIGSVKPGGKGNRKILWSQ